MDKIELYEKVEIDIYELIAKCIKELDMSDLKFPKDNKFDANCKKLQDMLLKMGIKIPLDDRYAKHFFNVGLNTLLQAIYDIKGKRDRIEVFEEQIYALRVIGVKKISFQPRTNKSGRIIESIGIFPDYKNKNEVILEKVYTDGSFGIENEGGYPHRFALYDLEKENYILHAVLKSENGTGKDEDGNDIMGELLDASISLANFKGVLPDKDEVLKMRLPMINTGRVTKDWQTTDGKVRMLLK